MGGLYGNATATALEDCPDDARGIVSGILQQGYTFGYLLATAFSRGLVNTTPHGWRPLYWFGACPPVLIILFRLYLPETKTFEARQEVRRQQNNTARIFIAECRVAISQHWLVLLYMVLLMAAFNFMAHGSQDLYPTMLQNQFQFSADAITVTQVVANLGAMVGGTVIGYCSQIFGRRFSIIVMCVIGGALLFPYTFVTSEKVAVAAFFEQLCVQGAWGVVPIHLMELAPGSLRTFVVGSAYQLGNLASSASSTIEAKIGERYPLPPGEVNGKIAKRYNYGKVICIFLGAVYAFTTILAVIGPEKKGRDLSVEFDEDMKAATNRQPSRQERDDEEKSAVIVEEVP
jgi:SHS family lactate transporter-like MFS transporter